MPEIDVTDSKVQEACASILRPLLSADEVESEQTLRALKLATAEWVRG